VAPTIASVQRADISAADKQLIFEGNARRLLAGRA